MAISIPVFISNAPRRSPCHLGLVTTEGVAKCKSRIALKDVSSGKTWPNPPSSGDDRTKTDCFLSCSPDEISSE